MTSDDSAKGQLGQHGGNSDDFSTPSKFVIFYMISTGKSMKLKLFWDHLWDTIIDSYVLLDLKLRPLPFRPEDVGWNSPAARMFTYVHLRFRG